MMRPTTAQKRAWACNQQAGVHQRLHDNIQKLAWEAGEIAAATTASIVAGGDDNEDDDEEVDEEVFEMTVVF